MVRKKYQLNRNEKLGDKAQQCFAFLHIQPNALYSKFEFLIFFAVKLIP
jgi:hypothetical protein